MIKLLFRLNQNFSRMEHIKRKTKVQPNEHILSTFSHVAMDLEPSFIPYKLDVDALFTNIVHILLTFQIARSLQLMLSLFSVDIHIIIAMIYSIIGLLLVLTVISHHTKRRYSDLCSVCVYYYIWVFIGLCVSRGVYIMSYDLLRHVVYNFLRNH